MIVKAFPKQQQTEKGICPVSRRFGQENIIVNASAKNTEYNDIRSPLSLKCTIHGSEWYSFGGREVLIDSEHVLLMDNQRTYSTFIQSESAVESFCIFFNDKILDELHTYRHANKNAWLDNPADFSVWDRPIIEKRLKIDRELLYLLKALKEQVDSENLELIDFTIYPILQKVLVAQQEFNQQISRLPFHKKATRVELYKRIALAQDFIDSCPYENLTLETLAKISCLSKYHFLRVFKEINGVSPHKYIVERKLEYAMKLIENGDSIIEVSRRVGFNSSASFCRSFKQKFGHSPGSIQHR